MPNESNAYKVNDASKAKTGGHADGTMAKDVKVGDGGARSGRMSRSEKVKSFAEQMKARDGDAESR